MNTTTRSRSRAETLEAIRRIDDRAELAERTGDVQLALRLQQESFYLREELRTVERQT